MARQRVTGPIGRNRGLNRTASTRANARRDGTFRGGLALNTGVSPQGVAPGGAGQPPIQNARQCPPGQEPGVNPDTGAQICKPAQANIAGDVPVINANRAINPGPGGGIPPRLKRGY